MRLELQCGNSDKSCWNVGAFQAYAEGVTNKENRHAREGLAVVAGSITCHGCMVNESGRMFCSAQISKTRIGDEGETVPQPDRDPDSFYGPIVNLPGFRVTNPGLSQRSNEDLASAEQIV
jgi:hypothetical protein